MGGGEPSRRRGGEAAPAQCAAEELCVCESLTGSKWRRLLQRLLLCEGNNTPPRQRRRQRRLRLAEHLPRAWACRHSVYSGQGALREEGQRQGAHPPESLLCDWGVTGGSSRSAEPGLRGRREGNPGPQPGAQRRSRPLRPPGPGPRSGGPGRRGEPRAGRSQLISRRSRAPEAAGRLLVEGTTRRALPAAGAGPGLELGLGLLTAGPGEAGAPRARRRGVVLPSPDASDSRSPKPEEEV